MIDNFAVILTEALMLIAAWRLLKRRDLDNEDARCGNGRWPRA